MKAVLRVEGVWRPAKVIAAVALIAGLSLVVAACGSSGSSSAGSTSNTGGGAASTTSGKPVSVAYLVSQLGNPFTEADIAGAKAYAAANNGSITVFNGNTNPQTQLSQCENAVTSGKYQALEISPIVGTALTGCVAQAKAKHIKVIAIDNPLGASFATLKPQMSGVTGSVMLNQVTQGDILGNEIKRACASKSNCQVGLIIGSPTFASNPVAEAAIKKTIAGDPQIHIVATAAGNYTEAGGQSAAQDMLAAHSGINILATFADQMAMGAQKAVTTAGKLKTVQLTGDGGSTNALTAICKGYWIGTVDANPYETGSDGAKLAILQVRGQNPPSEVAPQPNELTKANCGKASGLHLFTIAGA
jgi:ribose transport system substrate-binding protein